jgi:uridine kinase
VTKDTVVIGISGPSGSGKTALCQCLEKLLPDSMVLQQDLYFKPAGSLSEFDNFCDLDCLLLERFIRDVVFISSGEAIQAPNLDLNTFERLDGFLVFKRSRYVLIEGMTIFRIPEIYSLFNYRFYLSPGMDEIRRRKTQRDLEHRRKTKDEIEYQLSWVEQEYIYDLENLPGGINFISGNSSTEQICQQVFNHILGEAR